jgi:hypothetical protein
VGAECAMSGTLGVQFILQQAKCLILEIFATSKNLLQNLKYCHSENSWSKF